jgi:hypothetical protein
MESREVMLAKLRKKMAERGNSRDPDQFIPPKAKDKETLELYFWILPPLEKGETCKVGTQMGVAPESADLWYYPNGTHAIFEQRLECPRLHGEECPLCQFGFDLMGESTDAKYRSSIAKKYLPRSGFGANIYFPNIDKNPENLRGKVKWFNMPKTVCDIMEATLQTENEGDKEDPKACGIFYHPYEGGYTFKLRITKSGDWNEYKSSGFLPNTKGPLLRNKDGSPNTEAIQKVLDQRIWLPSKVAIPSTEKLQSTVDKVMAKQAGAEPTTEELVEEVKDKKLPPGITKGGAAKLPPKQESVLEAPTEAPVETVETPKPVTTPKAQTKPSTTTGKVSLSKPPPKKVEPVVEETGEPGEPDPDQAEIDKIVAEISKE